MSRQTEQPLTLPMPAEEPDTAAVQLTDSVLCFFPTAEEEWIPEDETQAPAPFHSPLRKAASDKEVFGSWTTAVFSVPQNRPTPRESALGHNQLLLDGLIFLIFFFYLTLLFRYRNPIVGLFRSLTIPGQFDQLIEEQNVSFRNFVRDARRMGFMTLVVIAFRGCLIWAGRPDSTFPEHFVPYLLPLLTGSLLAVLWYKRLAYGIISLLSKRKEKVENIRTFNRIFFTASALIFTPIALICTLSRPDWAEFFFMIQAIVLGILTLYYVGKSFSFFVSRKIPILQWILYLCAVEIWPVSFFVLFAGRGFEW